MLPWAAMMMQPQLLVGMLCYNMTEVLKTLWQETKPMAAPRRLNSSQCAGRHRSLASRVFRDRNQQKTHSPLQEAYYSRTLRKQLVSSLSCRSTVPPVSIKRLYKNSRIARVLRVRARQRSRRLSLGVNKPWVATVPLFAG